MTTSVTLGSLLDTRKNNLNALRLFFALLVIVSHSYPLVFGLATGSDVEPLYRLSHGQIDFGSLAVNCFFLMSGFLLVLSWEKSRGFLDFMFKRVLRVYPGLTVCILVCIFVVGPLGGVDLHHYFQNRDTYRLLQYLALIRFWNSLPGVFANNPVPEIIDSSLWTIKYEIFCYIIIAIMGVARLVKVVPVLIALAATYLFYNIVSILHISLPLALAPDYMPRFLTYFLMGSAFYLLRDKIPHNRIWLAVSVLAILFALHSGMRFVFPIFGAYCLFYFAFSPTIPLFGFGRKWDLSYGTYLYAWPIQQLLLQHVPVTQQPTILAIATIPLSLAAAAVSWALVERPFLEFKKKKLEHQNPVLLP